MASGIHSGLNWQACAGEHRSEVIPDGQGLVRLADRVGGGVAPPGETKRSGGERRIPGGAQRLRGRPATTLRARPRRRAGKGRHPENVGSVFGGTLSTARQQVAAAVAVILTDDACRL